VSLLVWLSRLHLIYIIQTQRRANTRASLLRAELTVCHGDDHLEPGLSPGLQHKLAGLHHNLSRYQPLTAVEVWGKGKMLLHFSALNTCDVFVQSKTFSILQAYFFTLLMLCHISNTVSSTEFRRQLYLRIEFHSGCIYWIINAMVKLANPWSALALHG